MGRYELQVKVTTVLNTPSTERVIETWSEIHSDDDLNNLIEKDIYTKEENPELETRVWDTELDRMAW